MSTPRPASQREIRRRNLSRVLRAVIDGGPLSRADVAARIGLTRSAVSTLVDELHRAGLLVEGGPGRTGGVGRPGTALEVTDRGPCGVGAEVGVDRLLVCATDLRGGVRAREEEAADLRGSDPATVLARLRVLLTRVTARARQQGLTPAGLAVAVPGLVARDSTTVVRTPNLGWPATDLREHLPGPLPLTVGNEADFGAQAERWMGGCGGRDDVVHVSARIGIGGAVVLGGQLLRGARGFAGELGHVPVLPEGRACGCGGRGCLEQYAGEEALLRAAGPAPAGPAAHREDRTSALADRAAAGEEAALRALRDGGRALGIALAGVVNLLDPEAVVLGGALARLGPYLIPPLSAELRARAAAPGPVPAVLVSALGADGPLLGAAHSVVRSVYRDPAAYATGRVAVGGADSRNG
ncbi:ROK family transcriptional regulator [Streptomyces sp. TR06-5]|uniref:ROK family transcriptional regulator n=1 Tax=unclassified Streptomyces TaxID=2593676 RepID=UPI0039A23345